MSPFFKNRHPRGDLSTYIDGELEPKRTATTEAHLTSCLECSSELAELRALRSALGSMPQVTAPRSFTLTQAQVAQKVPAATAGYRPTSLVTGLRLGGAGLAMALAVVVAIDAGGGPGDPVRDDAALEIQATDAETRFYDDTGEDAAYTGSPPIATGTPNTGGATGGGGVGSAGASVESDAPVSPTPAPGLVAAAGTPTPAAPNETAPTGDGEIVQSDTSDGGGETDATDGGKAADRATSSDGGNDLLVIEIILGVTAALALLASIVVARSRRKFT